MYECKKYVTVQVALAHLAVQVRMKTSNKSSAQQFACVSLLCAVTGQPWLNCNKNMFVVTL